MSTLWHPDAEQVIVPGREGKPWVGGSSSRPKLVLHTWEFASRWPNYSTPPHMSAWLRPYSPTGVLQLQQHVPFNRAAYSCRDGKSENNRDVWQVELSGYAHRTVNEADDWYEDLASVIVWFHMELGLPLLFADFEIMDAGIYAPQRFSYSAFDSFVGILGHGHVGRGIDTHWDPGSIDVARLVDFIGGSSDMWANDITDKTWHDMFESGVPGISGNWRYYCSNDGSIAFSPPWGQGPVDANGNVEDGKADYGEKVHALNYLFQGFSAAAGSG